MITILNWNVNSVKSRLTHLLSILEEEKPDIVTLQEIKCVNEAFPSEQIEDLGYNILINGQKTYNGVAILSKFPLAEVAKNFPDMPRPEQARYLEAEISVDGDFFRVISVYVPNGGEVASDKFQYKLQFLESFYKYTQTLLEYREKLVICGDYNIAPFDEDVYDAHELKNGTCFTEIEKSWLRKFLNNGFYDSYRLKYPQGKDFTWWDYRAGAWQKNHGMRIDHILVSSEAADCLENFSIDFKTRAKDKPSDHSPIKATFSS